MNKFWKKRILILFFWAFFLVSIIGGNLVLAETPTNIIFSNPVGTPTITGFFENVMIKLGNIIAFLAVLSLVVGGIMYVMAGMGGGNETLKGLAQKTITFAVVGLALALVGPALLREIKIIVLGGVNAPMPTNIGQAPSIAQIVTRTLQFLLSIVGILAIISLVIGGIMYIIAGTVDIAQRAAKTVQYSVIGIIVTGGALIIVRKIVEIITQR